MAWVSARSSIKIKFVPLKRGGSPFTVFPSLRVFSCIDLGRVDDFSPIVFNPAIPNRKGSFFKSRVPNMGIKSFDYTGFNLVNEDVNSHFLIFEDPSISFLPNFPRQNGWANVPNFTVNTFC